MNTTHIVRCTALAVVLMVAMPAPASPQIGGALKKMKAKITRTLGADTTSKASAPGMSAAAPSTGLVFSGDLLEITPGLLDRLEMGLAAEQADRKAAPKLLFGAAYDQCKDALEKSAPYQKEYQAFIARYADLPESKQPDALRENMKHQDAQLRAQCGPPFNEADTLQFTLPRRAEEAGRAATGLTARQYAILKERIMPLCEATETTTGSGGELQVPKKESSHVFFLYKPTEVDAIRPRCSKLTALFPLEPRPGKAKKS